jgi:hypothetical protein
LTVRRTLEGARRDVLHLSTSRVCPVPESGPVVPAGADRAGEAAPDKPEKKEGKSTAGTVGTVPVAGVDV